MYELQNVTELQQDLESLLGRALSFRGIFRVLLHSNRIVICLNKLYFLNHHVDTCSIEPFYASKLHKLSTLS